MDWEGFPGTKCGILPSNVLSTIAFERRDLWPPGFQKHTWVPLPIGSL